MDVVYGLGKATAKEIQRNLPDPPSYSAVRAVLSRLVRSGLLRYSEEGPRYVYSATENPQRIRRDALRKLMDTFFEGSPLDTINALLGYSASQLSKAELDEIALMIAKASEKKHGE
jgi:predicted transcriptional regulator